MALTMPLLVVLGTTLVVLVQASPVPHRNAAADGQGAFTAAVLPASEFSDWHNETRQRDKERRLKAIELFILEALGRTNKTPTPPQPQPGSANGQVDGVDGHGNLFQRDLSTNPPPTNHHHPRGNNTFPGQLDSFKASCELPSKVDAEAWNQPADFFRIFFNLSTLDQQNLGGGEKVKEVMNGEGGEVTMTTEASRIPMQGSRGQPLTTPSTTPKTSTLDMPRVEFPTSKTPRRPIPTPTVNIISAKLRLYKIGRGPNAEPARFELPKTSEFCNNTNDEIAAHQQLLVQRHQQPSSSIVSENPTSVEEKIFVKVYWYTAPVTKNHYKKKLLYSRTLLVKESGWIDFDIQKAAKTWLGSKINYGLTLEVENEDNDLVDVGTYFSNVDCPLMTNLTSKRVPPPRSGGFGFRTPEPIQSYPAPILELCTLTLPADPARGAPVSYKISSFSSKGRIDPTGLDLDPESSHEEQFWQSDDDESRKGPEVLDTDSSTTSLPPVHHRRRHHHGASPHRSSLAARNTHRRDFGSSGMQRDSPMDPTTDPTTTTEFALDADHPLKKIFATAKTYLSRDEMYNRRRKYHQINRNQNRPGTEEGLNGVGDEGGIGGFQPIILEAENIVIENNRQRR